jgi:hypothetical protein
MFFGLKMIPACRHYGSGLSVRIVEGELLVRGDFTDGKQRAPEFFFKVMRNFFCAVRRYRAQQGIIFTAGKGLINRIKINTPAKVFQAR